MSKKIQVTEFTREDGLKLHGGPLGWIITLTGYGPTWVYKDRWVLVTSPEVRTVGNTYYPTLEDAMDVFETVELPPIVKG